TCPCCGQPRSDNSSPATARRIPASSPGHHAHRNLSFERKRRADTSRSGRASPEPHGIEPTSPRQPPTRCSNALLRTHRLLFEEGSLPPYHVAQAQRHIDADGSGRKAFPLPFWGWITLPRYDGTVGAVRSFYHFPRS